MGHGLVRAVAALLLALTAATCASPAAPTPLPGAGASVGPVVEDQQEHEAGAVTVTASWIAATASVTVAMNTHSVDLDLFDLTRLAQVRLDGGAWIAPTAWDAPKGGHHRSGTLVFGSLDAAAISRARVIELEIRDVGAASHLLRWARSP